MSLRTIRILTLITILVIVAGYIGYQLGMRRTTFSLSRNQGIVVHSSPPPAKEVDFNLFWNVWERLETKYLDKSKLDSQKMVYGAISGMVSSLGDPYTVFLPPQENTEFKKDLEGSFEGIGAQLGAKDEKIVVIAPLKAHPAERAGIRAGDWIVKVGSEETLGWTVPQAVTKIRGPKGTQVTLTIVHEGEQSTQEIKVTRATIVVKSVEVELKPVLGCSTNCPQIGYLKLSRFGDQTNDEWSDALGVLKSSSSKKELKGVILDLRNNPGGYFQSAIFISSEFLRSGLNVVSQENNDGSKENFSVTRLGSFLDVPLIVIINKGSASASEIVAGALKDHGRALLVGETTFGKGSIQSPEDLPDGSGIHITTARWVMPKGAWINGKGIAPDIEVKSPRATDSGELDPQLDRAIVELSGR